jgi:hypothetical protein
LPASCFVGGALGALPAAPLAHPHSSAGANRRTGRTADEGSSVDIRHEPVMAVRETEVPAFARETIRPTDFDVAEIPDDITARNFIREHHYSGSMGAARVRVGLYRHGVLVGVAVFSHPCSDAVLTRTFSVPAASAVELGRFVLLDEVEVNAESFL